MNKHYANNVWASSFFIIINEYCEKKIFDKVVVVRAAPLGIRLSSPERYQQTYLRYNNSLQTVSF